MKLLTITAVKDFEKDIREIFEGNKVNSFSYLTVTGYRDSTTENVNQNWFATEMNRVESNLFYAYVDAEIAIKIFDEIESLNKRNTHKSKVHIAITPIEKYNN